MALVVLSIVVSSLHLERKKKVEEALSECRVKVKNKLAKKVKRIQKSEKVVMLRRLKAERKVISLIERKREEEIKEESEKRSRRRSRKDRAMSGLRETLNRSYSREASTPRTPKTPKTPRTPRAPTNTPGKEFCIKNPLCKKTEILNRPIMNTNCSKASIEQEGQLNTDSSPIPVFISGKKYLQVSTID